MIKEPLFKVLSLTHEEGNISAVLEIDQLNEIFKGHFPDHPVVPGACMLQIVKEILADALDKSLHLTKADNIKFLTLVEPSTQSLQVNISYQLSGNDIKVSVSLLSGEVTFMKLQGVFVSQQV